MFMAPIGSDEKSVPVDPPFSASLFWPAMASAMIAEINDGATPDQARGLFHTLGKRIAALVPVQDLVSMDGLCDRINGLWAQLGCGRVTMALDDQGISLRHDDPPSMPYAADQGDWSIAIAPLLEGAYDAWFQAMGSHAAMHTRVIAQTDGTIDLRHAL